MSIRLQEPWVYDDDDNDDNHKYTYLSIISEVPTTPTLQTSININLIQVAIAAARTAMVCHPSSMLLLVSNKCKDWAHLLSKQCQYMFP